MSKTLEEINLEILKIASDNVNVRYGNSLDAWQLAAFKGNSTEPSLNEVPEYNIPSTQQILLEARALKDFIYKS